MTGVDTMMFGSDDPHAESTWPNSRRFIDNRLAGAPAEVRRKLICDNVAKLYKFHSPPKLEAEMTKAVYPSVLPQAEARDRR